MHDVHFREFFIPMVLNLLAVFENAFSPADGFPRNGGDLTRT